MPHLHVIQRLLGLAATVSVAATVLIFGFMVVLGLPLVSSGTFFGLFAMDWLPFLLLATVLGIRRLPWRLAVPPLVMAVLINGWGVAAVANWESWSAFVR